MIDFSQFDSLIAMTMYFNNEDTCRQAIVETRWGIGENQDIVCPYCGQHHCATRKDGKFFPDLRRAFRLYCFVFPRNAFIYALCRVNSP